MKARLTTVGNGNKKDANKWRAVPDRQTVRKALRELLLAQIFFPPILMFGIIIALPPRRFPSGQYLVTCKISQLLLQ